MFDPKFFFKGKSGLEPVTTGNPMLTITFPFIIHQKEQKNKKSI